MQKPVVFRERMESLLLQWALDLLEAEDERMSGPSSLMSRTTLTAQRNAMDADAERYDSQHSNHQSHQMLCTYSRDKV